MELLVFQQIQFVLTNMKCNGTLWSFRKSFNLLLPGIRMIMFDILECSEIFGTLPIGFFRFLVYAFNQGEWHFRVTGKKSNGLIQYFITGAVKNGFQMPVGRR